MMCIDYNVMIYVGATTEVEALKKALSEAEEKAAKEQAARKKLKGQAQRGPARAPGRGEKVRCLGG